MPTPPRRSMPRDALPDATLALLNDPYRYIQKRARRFDSDAFEARILFRKTVCLTGVEAAELFYDTERFAREGAAPLRLQRTLFGRGGVQGLDNGAHRDRKRMLVDVMTPERARRLARLSQVKWQEYAQKWQSQTHPVVLYRETREILCAAVCEWAGVPLALTEVGERTDALTSLFESAGAVGFKHWKGRRDRKRLEDWAGDLIEQVRRGELELPADSALHAIATYEDADGQPLPRRIAAVELLNVLRPTVAVAVYITFAACALHEHPEARARLQSGGDQDLHDFVQEVRRFYPFFPAVMAVARRDIEWNGYIIDEGTQTLLDLYGTNHDPRSWTSPETFRPERFREWNESPYNFIPQGGGEHRAHHRCAGEWLTIELMKRAADFLATKMTFDAPPQDLTIDMKRLPALPRSGMVIENVAVIGE